MSFGKIAHDIVMRMQKIDGDNYPEVIFFVKLKPNLKTLSELMVHSFADFFC